MEQPPIETNSQTVSISQNLYFYRVESKKYFKNSIPITVGCYELMSSLNLIKLFICKNYGRIKQAN